MSHPTHVQERNQEATVYVGDLDPQVTESILWELFLQAGPVVNVHIPKDKLTGVHSGYGFVEFHSEEDAEYSMKIMNMIKLFGKPIRVNKASQDKKTVDIGANLFIGNLDPEIDEKMLYDTFSAFGVIISTPRIMRDQESGQSRGFGFISYNNFESSDAAISAMNGQYLSGRPITVTYALKKDSKVERHGSVAERLLASKNPITSGIRPPIVPMYAPMPAMSPVGYAMPSLSPFPPAMVPSPMMSSPGMILSPPGMYPPAPPPGGWTMQTR